jgi:hypothetical protein
MIMVKTITVLKNRLIFLCLALLVLESCTTTGVIIMDVKAYSDPEEDLFVVKRFKLAPINRENPLLEKELLFMIKNRLMRKGYIYNEINPDFLVAINFYCGPYQYYVPPTTLYLSSYVPGETKTFSGTIGGTYFQGSEVSPGYYENVPYVTGGYFQTAYYRNIQLYFVDHNELVQNKKIKLIWMGEVDSNGSNSDIRIVAPYLLNELISEFPEKSGKPNKRSVIWSNG